MASKKRRETTNNKKVAENGWFKLFRIYLMNECEAFFMEMFGDSIPI